MIKLYGPPTTRVMMCVWTLDECGVDYEHVKMEFPDTKKPEYLAINPNGKVPTLVDGEFKLFESMAISQFVARQYGAGKIWPEGDAAQAHALQWAFWAATELEPNMVSLFGQTLMTPPPQRDEKVIEKAREKIARALKVLDGAVADGHLLGEHFSVADLNVAAVLAPGRDMLQISLADYPNVDRWEAGCKERPHYAKLQAAMDAFAKMIDEMRKKGPPPGAGGPPPKA